MRVHAVEHEAYGLARNAAQKDRILQQEMFELLLVRQMGI
jgi:hypothetical protein